MRSILLLAPFDLFPPVHGGSAIVHSFIRVAVKKHKIHALITHMHSQGGNIDVVHKNLNITYCPKTVLDNLKVLSILFNPVYLIKAYQIMKNIRADIIQCEILWTGLAGVFLKMMFKRPVVLVEHNVEYLKYKYMDGILHLILAYILRLIEWFVCRMVDRIVVFSDVDKKHITQLYGVEEKNIKVISPCLALDEFINTTDGSKSREKIREKHDICDEIVCCFVGNLKYLPNIQGVRYIVRFIYPVIRKRYPECKFIIIGQADDKLLAESSKDGIIFTGYLTKDELVEYMLACDIVLVPIETGSGVRVKIFEAAACGKPIVSTQKGAEGLEFVDNQEILLSDGVDERFIENIFKLIDDKSLRDKIGNNAREKVIRKYSWSGVLDEFEMIYDDMITKVKN
jgi:glycosyltransferase involved in cell wall biosynthesis